MARLSYLLIVSIFASFHAVALEHTSPTSSSQSVAKRADPPVPTITFRPIENYLVKKDALRDPEPSGDKLQMYPQGIYDDFPKDGVTVVFGPDLKQRIKDAIGDDCQNNPGSCRDRLMPVLQNTDVHTHAKRFILISAFLITDVVAALSYLLVAGSAAAAGAGAAWLASDVPAVKLDYSDLAQIHDLGKVDKIVVEQGENATPTTIAVPAVTETPTPTGSAFITMETLTADSEKAKKGDIIFHIPVDTAHRIQDFLAMLGVQSLVETCKGFDLFNPQNSRVRRDKRADNIETCLRAVANFAPEWIEGAPEDVLQLAPQNIPNLPGTGQGVAFPVQNVMVDGGRVVVMVYHVVLQHERPAIPAPGLNYLTLARSATGLTILLHVVMHAGQMALDIVLPQSSVATDVKEDDLSCPADMLCVDDACGAQKNDVEIPQRNAFCTKPKTKGCECKSITYPHHLEVEKGYMDEQYEWMEELMRRADNPTPNFEVKCSGALQQDKSLSDMFRDKIKEMCKDHVNVREGADTSGSDGTRAWTVAKSEPGVSWGFIFQTTPKDTQTTCSFDCETVFLAFADNKDCVKDDGLLKNGEIRTDCGVAYYNAYKLGN